jgi:hypothetical protein
MMKLTLPCSRFVSPGLQSWCSLLSCSGMALSVIDSQGTFLSSSCLVLGTRPPSLAVVPLHAGRAQLYGPRYPL